MKGHGLLSNYQYSSTPMKKHKILIAEDDIDLGNVLKMYIEMNGFEPYLVCNGEEACQRITEIQPDLCILDVMMPKLDGFETAEIIMQSIDVPIIFLTARNQKKDRLKGLQLGADDYITKPFEPDELVLRMKNILSRVKRTEQDTIQIGNYLLHKKEMQLVHKDKVTQLTEKENTLLDYFYTHRKSLLKRNDILNAVWGDNDYFVGRSMDVFITRIRRLLKEDPSIKIENVRGVGYRFIC